MLNWSQLDNCSKELMSSKIYVYFYFDTSISLIPLKILFLPFVAEGELKKKQNNNYEFLKIQ